MLASQKEMKRIRSYVTNPEHLDSQFLDNNSLLARSLNATVKFVIHGKELFEPSISPILGSGLPKLSSTISDDLRKELNKYTEEDAGLSFLLSPDIFAEMFSNVDAHDDLLLHSFSINEADFILHNVYSDRALDSAFNQISPALFIPDGHEFSVPSDIYILLFSKDMGSDLSGIVKMATTLGSKINFVIQEPTDNRIDESILEKVAEMNNLDLSEINFSARFVDKIDAEMISEIGEIDSTGHWMVFQHSFLIKDFNDKTLTVDMYNLLQEAEHPVVIV